MLDTLLMEGCENVVGLFVWLVGWMVGDINCVGDLSHKCKAYAALDVIVSLISLHR